MSLNFKFNNQLQTDMDNIKMNLIKSNAIELVFNNKKTATEQGTHLISVNGKPVNSKYNFLEPMDNNIYFLFDNNFVCQYVGKKANQEGINYRLKLHLLKNETKISSAIKSVCKYLNEITNSKRIIYLITFRIEPSYMVESVESYFIDYFRDNGGGQWILRK